MLTHTMRLSRGMLAMGILVAAAAQAAPPPLPQPNADPQSIDNALRNRAAYWINNISTATEAKEVQSARLGLTQDYRSAMEFNRPGPYTAAVATGAKALLTGGIKPTDSDASLKTVSIGLAVARMPQLSALPALKVMVQHPNGGIRYLGWKGYTALRGQLLSQGSDDINEMLALLTAADAKETSAAVAREEYEAMNFGPNIPAGIPAALLKDASARVLATMAKTWRSRCAKIAGGDNEWAVAAVRGLSALESADARLDGDREQRKQLRQMLLDVAWCAAFALDEAVKDGLDAESEQRPADVITAETTQSAMTTLLMSCELALRRVTRLQRTPIGDALGKGSMEEAAINIRLAVSEWAQLLKEDGVTMPNADDFGKAKPRKPREPKEPATGTDRAPAAPAGQTP